MSNPAHPCAVHVAVDEALAQRLKDSAATSGDSVMVLELSGVLNRDELSERLAEAFKYPHRAAGLDAAIDLMSDLEWLGEASGYLLLVETDGTSEEAASALAGILPAVIDRWRTQETPFVAAILGTEYLDATTRALERTNRALQEFSDLPWTLPGTAPVPVIDHRTGKQ